MIKLYLAFILLIFLENNQAFAQEKFIAQDYSPIADTIVIEGYIVSFIEKIYFKKKKNEILIDYINGAGFLLKEEFKSKRKITVNELDIIKKGRDSAYITYFDGNFKNLDYWFFNEKLPKDYGIDLFPHKKKYSKRDKRYIYNYFCVKAKCVKINIPIKSNQKLLRFFFNFSEKQLQREKLPVYTIIEIQEYKYLK